MGVARAWSRSEMGKFLPSLSVNFIIYLQNVWSAMSLSLLVPEEKKLPISINFQKSVYPLYICISHKTKGCDIWPPLKSQFGKRFLTGSIVLYSFYLLNESKIYTNIS